MADGATQTRVRTWEDRSWISRDGLDLHYRDYAGPVEKPPMLRAGVSVGLPPQFLTGLSAWTARGTEQAAPQWNDGALKSRG